jgi:hypothetical protein
MSIIVYLLQCIGWMFLTGGCGHCSAAGIAKPSSQQDLFVKLTKFTNLHMLIVVLLGSDYSKNINSENYS